MQKCIHQKPHYYRKNMSIPGNKKKSTCSWIERFDNVKKNILPKALQKFNFHQNPNYILKVGKADEGRGGQFF